MANKNTSDHIEDYIKAILAQAGFVELRRSELADSFQVVPSQINYVIKTRFTESRGYVVESKRGGGGYIRIEQIKFSNHHEMLKALSDNISECVNQQVFDDLIQLLFDKHLLTENEGNLLLSMTGDAVLGIEADFIRSRMLKKILNRLDREE